MSEGGVKERAGRRRGADELAGLQVGSVLMERYSILKVLGRGGFGVVLKACQLNTEQLVAIKMMRGVGSDVQIERFRRELEVLARLNHPHIVQLIDTGEYNDQMFMVLEFVEGGTLRDRLMDGRLTAALTKRVLQQVLEALEVTHGHGVVHRDLKPPNIMLTGPKHRPIVKVLDFGVALGTHQFNEDWETLTSDGMFTGTPHYIAPETLITKQEAEEAQMEITPISDLYTMGLIAFECLTGERAIPGKTPFEVCMNQIKKPVVLPPELRGTDFGDFILKATQKHPKDRFQSASEMIDALERVDAPDRVLVSALGGLSESSGDSSEYVKPSPPRLPRKSQHTPILDVARHGGPVPTPPERTPTLPELSPSELDSISEEIPFLAEDSLEPLLPDEVPRLAAADHTTAAMKEWLNEEVDPDLEEPKERRRGMVWIPIALALLGASRSSRGGPTASLLRLWSLR